MTGKVYVGGVEVAAEKGRIIAERRRMGPALDRVRDYRTRPTQCVPIEGADGARVERTAQGSRPTT